MTTNRDPLVRLHLYARRTIMPTILHDNNIDQQAAEQTSREISRNVARRSELPESHNATLRPAAVFPSPLGADASRARRRLSAPNYSHYRTCGAPRPPTSCAPQRRTQRDHGLGPTPGLLTVEEKHITLMSLVEPVERIHLTRASAPIISTMVGSNAASCSRDKSVPCGGIHTDVAVSAALSHTHG